MEKVTQDLLWYKRCGQSAKRIIIMALRSSSIVIIVLSSRFMTAREVAAYFLSKLLCLLSMLFVWKICYPLLPYLSEVDIRLKGFAKS